MLCHYSLYTISVTYLPLRVAECSLCSALASLLMTCSLDRVGQKKLQDNLEVTQFVVNGVKYA